MQRLVLAPNARMASRDCFPKAGTYDPSCYWVGGQQDPMLLRMIQNGSACGRFRFPEDYPEEKVKPSDPFHTQWPLAHQVFFGEQNTRYLQEELRRRGYCNPPKADELRLWMTTAYTDDPGYGAYGAQLGDDNCYFEACDQATAMQYVNLLVARWNHTVLRRVAENIDVMSFAYRSYIRDMSFQNGVFEIDRPLDSREGLARHGPEIRTDFQLPDERCMRVFPGNACNSNRDYLV